MTLRALVLVSALLAGCGGSPMTSDGGPEGGSKPNPCANKPNYVFPDMPSDMYPNGFTLAACASYMDAEKGVMNDATNAAQFITPLAGAKLPKMPAYKFSWSAGMLMAGATDGGAASGDGGSSAQSTTGTGYVVYFIDANTSKELLRVLTTQTQFTPDDAAWAKITATNALQLKIVAAPFVSDQVAGTPLTPPQPRLVEIQQM